MKLREIGGRKWRAVERSTLRHDNYMIRHILEGGLDKLRHKDDESLEDFAMRMLHAVLASGKMFDLLGGMLLPENVPDEKWTEAQAGETAEFLGNVTEEHDKTAVQEALMPLLLSFFAAGMDFIEPSRTALKKAEEAHPERALNIVSEVAATTSVISASGATLSGS